MEYTNNGLGKEDEFGYLRIDRFNEERSQKIANLYSQILDVLGENIDREGLEKTPIRVAKPCSF